jgi:hypothetical protein
MRSALFVLFAATLAACSSGPGTSPDPFFTQALRDTARPEPGPEVPRVERDGYEVALRFLESGPDATTLSLPTITLLPERPGRFHVGNEMAYLKTFEVEHTEDAWVADPVIAKLVEGLTFDLLVTPLETSRSAILTWHAAQVHADKPLATRRLLLAAEAQPVDIQLPVLTRAEATGRTPVRMGEETRLARIPYWRADRGTSSWLTVLARVRPARVVVPEEPDETARVPMDLAAIFRSRPIEDAEPSSLAISVVSLKRDPGAEPLLLDAGAARGVLASLDSWPFREFVLGTVSEPGVRVAYLQERAIVRDYEVMVREESHSLAEPIVDEVTAGLVASIEDRDGTPTLVWSYRTVPVVATFSTSLAGRIPVTLDLPETVETSGVLPLTADVALARLGRTPEGRYLAVLVKRG